MTLGDRKIKILYVVSTLRQSGPTNQLLGIVSNLNKNKFDPLVLTLSPEPVNSRKNEFLNAGVKVDSLELTRIEFNIIGNRRLKNYIQKYRPAVIHSSGIRADIAVSKIKTISKHCMTVRNFAFNDYVSKYGKTLGNIAAKKSIVAMESCDYVICCSKTLKHMYQEILSRKIYYVQNGVDTKKYIPPSNLEEKMVLRSKLSLPEGKKIFIVVGSLIKRKDPLSIIQAFKNAKVDGKAILILLGEGDLLEQCRKEADEDIWVEGNVSNVRDYLKASDIYISASKSEGLPNSVLEAGSIGLDMVLSNIPQHREIFENKMEIIQRFEVGDIGALTSAIQKNIENELIDIKHELATFIEEKFSNKTMSENYEDIYGRMVEG